MATQEPKKARIIKAPHPLPVPLSAPSLFLSGTISPANTDCWRENISKLMSHLPVTILNPLRPDWDSSWKEDLNEAKFVEQVSWEFDALEKADIVAVYFGKETQAPITLLELGFVAGRGKKIIVCCPEGYVKRGNVQVLCQKLGITVVDSHDEMLQDILVTLRGLGIET